MLAEQLAELEALGLLELAAEVVGAHAVGLVDDDEVPLGLCRAAASRSSLRASWSMRAISSGLLLEDAEAPNTVVAELRS